MFLINANVLDGKFCLRKADIEIEDGKIVRLEDSLPYKEEDLVVDCAGYTIVPGFVDVHKILALERVERNKALYAVFEAHKHTAHRHTAHGAFKVLADVLTHVLCHVAVLGVTLGDERAN